jgi:CDGSH-type Zn-finger protein
VTVKISCRQRGPLVVEFAPGELELIEPSGQPRELGDVRRVLLCRCGASKSRPYCDGSHHRVAFDVPPTPTQG